MSLVTAEMNTVILQTTENLRHNSAATTFSRNINCTELVNSHLQQSTGCYTFPKHVSSSNLMFLVSSVCYLSPPPRFLLNAHVVKITG
jgi:hypothetical protein